MSEDDPTAIDPEEAEEEARPPKPALELPPEEGVEYDGEEEEVPEEEFLDPRTARQDDSVDDEEAPPSASER